MARRQRRREKKFVNPMVAWRRDVRRIGMWTVISVAAAGGVAWVVHLLG